MRVIVVVSLAAAAAVITACGGSDAGPTTPKVTNRTWDVVTIEESFQDPSQVVGVGDTVQWHFNKATSDGLGHNVRFFPRITGSPADIGTQGAPLTTGVQTRVFTIKGDFKYVCDLHGGMVGEVIAQ
jgi:plastocyanin